MPSRTEEYSSIFNRLAAVILAILYRFLTLHQFVSFAFYKLKHGVRYLREKGSGKFPHELEKKPDHLAIVFTENAISFSDIAKLVSWCSEADIEYVTLFEPRGVLKSSVDRLLRAIEKLSRSKFKVNLHFLSPNGHQEMASVNNVRKVVHVHVADSKDGRGAIVEAARKLHENQRGVTIENVDSMLKVTCDWPEPDLLIRCGGLSSHLGFLPWALRLTEFADLYSHHFLFPSEFRDILATFSRTDRRCGR